jgi:hypothetical protein
MFHQWNEEPTTTTTPPLMQPQIRKFFTNSTGGQQPYDGESFYVNISSKGPPGNKRFDGANPQHVVNIVDFQNGGNIMVKITTVGSFPGINQVITINITGITINPGEHMVILIKTEFAGEGQPYNPGYFNSGLGSLGSYNIHKYSES